jgi:hypothetical protein
MSDVARFNVGGNNPPPDLKIGESLREQLRDEHRALLARRDELLQMADDFDADYATVDDDEASGTLAGIITQIVKSAKIADQTREGIKAPYLEGGRIVDGFFNGNISTKLNDRAKKLNEKQTAYQRVKADRARREAEAAAAKARAEEDARRRDAERAERERRAAELAERRAADDANASIAARQRAEDATRRAEEARQAEERARIEREEQARIAASSAADRSRVRGDYAVSSLRTTWAYEIVDITKVPSEFLQVNGPLVNAAIRGQKGRRDIPGLRIFPVETAQNR